MLFLYLAFVSKLYTVFGHFWHICKKAKIRILEVQSNSNKTVPVCFLKLYFEEIGHETLLQTIGSLSCVGLSERPVPKIVHIIQFPLAVFARICENLLVSGLLDVNELA